MGDEEIAVFTERADVVGIQKSEIGSFLVKRRLVEPALGWGWGDGCRGAEMKVLGVVALRKPRSYFGGLYTLTWRAPSVPAEMRCR